jgi:rod shape-determining protein MreD
MGVLVLGVLLLLAAAVPDLVPASLGAHSHPPDLWVAATVYLALRARRFQAIKWAVGIGFVRDGLSLDPLGTHAFVLGTLAWLLAEGSRPRGALTGPLRLFLTAVGAIGASWLYLLRILPMGGADVSLGSFVDAFPSALWTTVAAATLFPVLDRGRLLDDLCGRRRDGLPA